MDGGGRLGDIIDANPQFCNVGSGELTLHSDSPCLPEGNEWGALIGAFGQGCPSYKDWTLLVYINGDNDLETCALSDFNEMEQIGSPSNTNVVVMLDRRPGGDDSQGDWFDTRRYYIIQDSDVNSMSSMPLIPLWDSTQYEELNMGDPNTMVDFFEWGAETFPADRYSLIVWDHGNGWRSGSEERLAPLKGFSSDWSSGNSYISIAEGEWEVVLDGIHSVLGHDLDLLGFDCCLMQMWEVMHASRDHVDIMVGPEQNETCDGWDYTHLLANLDESSSIDAETLGQYCVDAAVEGDNQKTCSSVRLSSIQGLSNSINTFAGALLDEIETHPQTIDAWRQYLHLAGHEFGLPYYDHIDIYDFAECIANDVLLPAELRNAAQDVCSSVASAVTYNRTRWDYSWAQGIAIYFPRFPDDYEPWYNELPSSQETLWGDFVSFPRVITSLPESEGKPNSISIQAFPNPFNPLLTVEYSIPSDIDGTLIVFDVSGRHIRVLTDGQFTRGANEIVWNGQDDHGQDVASGVYFVRLAAEEHQESKKVVLLR